MNNASESRYRVATWRTNPNSQLNMYVLIAVAFCFWFVMFSPWTAPLVNFWAVMACAATVLACSAIVIDRRSLSGVYRWHNSYIVVGVLSAAVLYAVFFAGNELSRLILNFAGRDIENIYSTKSQASNLTIGLLLLLWVGPAEEVFWRGFAQRRLVSLFAKNAKPAAKGKSDNGVKGGFSRLIASPDFKAYIAASLIYALVHIWGFNLMLFGAALVCGLFWGAMFLKYRSVWPGLISHAIWDLAIFVLWPVK